MAARSSAGRRGKGVNVGEADVSWEDAAVLSREPALDAINLPSLPGTFILGDG